MGSTWLVEEPCSMGSVKQGRGPRGAVQLSWDVLRIPHDRIPGLAWFSVDPAWSRRLDYSPSQGHLHSFWEWCSGIRSKWLGGLHGAWYIVPGWNDWLSNGPNTETAFPFQQGLELCTPSSNFWSLAFINFRDPYFTPGVCVVSRRFLVNIVFTLR